MFVLGFIFRLFSDFLILTVLRLSKNFKKRYMQIKKKKYLKLNIFINILLMLTLI